MVKLDVSMLRFMEPEDFRVLTALEMAMRNHDVAPTALVERIAQLPHGGCRKRLGMLLKHKMIHHENTMYDGYAMKYGAYDYLALRTMSRRGTCTGVAHRIGCGKESDIILVEDENGHECVLKLQRLGRCSFRTVTRNRDYKGNGQTRRGESWFYLSRLASQKEYAFMRLLYDEGFPVPKPIDQNRHALLMGLVPGTLLNNILDLEAPDKVYRRCLDLMIKLGEQGLIHGDFNEFNIMITADERVVMIDFPQMVSTNHPNGEELFQRDVVNLANFFRRRFRLETLWYPTLADDVVRQGDLDKQVYASGHYTQRQEEDLKTLMEEDFNNGLERRADGGEDGDDDDDGDDEDDEGEDEEDDEDDEDTEGEIDRADCGVIAIPRGAAAEGEGEDDDEDGDGEGDGDDGDSLDEAVAAARLLRGEEAGGNANNRNFRPDGEIDREHLKNQVRKSIKRRDNQEFYGRLHRNSQKGHHKQKIGRELKKADANGFW